MDNPGRKGRASGPRPRAVEPLDESIASQARISPRRVETLDPHGDPRAGGDASKAPTSLRQTELHPIEGASSGVSWDDPDEL
ncbi:hypothetical protein LEP48_11370 [Isoptericola sp. NEAU-Y5]|uniref:Uncharacterized protein n=1 Tax=Isoptericola luteus TaxID=2879484 RepID=A0ABS7ZJY8_9MICO|nr:hypothetical protein [Isoptericola sp. NEAU-Y5]MCA5893949.1 hypothetical protein [Isoptericola sp. NEAU-Y5]